MFGSYQKIFALGNKQIADLLNGNVEVTEKIDGSAISFGVVDGELRMRSKNCELDLFDPNPLFANAVSYITRMFEEGKLGGAYPDEEVVYYAEWLQKPKHNSLTYERTPLNGLALYGCVVNQSYVEYDILAEMAEYIGIDAVPLIYSGKIDSKDQVLAMLERESYLGSSPGQHIEGVVIKRFGMEYEYMGKFHEVMAGKYVSEKFKEVHNKNWKSENTGKGKLQTLMDSYRTDARWYKAIQHLRDEGVIPDDDRSPKDIGALIRAIREDILEEEVDNIKDRLFNIFKGDILRNATKGFPEWYKKEILGEAFDV